MALIFLLHWRNWGNSATEFINWLQLNSIVSLYCVQISLNISKIWAERHHSRCWWFLSCIIIFPSRLNHSQQHCVSFLSLLTLYKKLSGLKKKKFIFLQFQGSEFQNGFARICFFWGLQWRMQCLSFSVTGGLLHPWFMPPPSVAV